MSIRFENGPMFTDDSKEGRPTKPRPKPFR